MHLEILYDACLMVYDFVEQMALLDGLVETVDALQQNPATQRTPGKGKNRRLILRMEPTAQEPSRVDVSYAHTHHGWILTTSSDRLTITQESPAKVLEQGADLQITDRFSLFTSPREIELSASTGNPARPLQPDVVRGRDALHQYRNLRKAVTERIRSRR